MPQSTQWPSALDTLLTCDPHQVCLHAKETFCFQSKWFSSISIQSEMTLTFQPQKAQNPAMAIGKVSCLWFPPAAPLLLVVAFLMRNTWLGCSFYSYKSFPQWARKRVSWCPEGGISSSSLHLPSSADPTLRSCLKQLPGDLPTLIDAPDLSSTFRKTVSPLRKQVVCRLI